MQCTSKKHTPRANFDRRAYKMEVSSKSSSVNMSFGVPTDEAMKICKRIYRNDVTKLTVQIASPDVMQVQYGITGSPMS